MKYRLRARFPRWNHHPEPFASLDTGLSCPRCAAPASVRVKKGRYVNGDHADAYCVACGELMYVRAAVVISFSTPELYPCGWCGKPGHRPQDHR